MIFTNRLQKKIDTSNIYILIAIKIETACRSRHSFHLCYFILYQASAVINMIFFPVLWLLFVLFCYDSLFSFIILWVGVSNIHRGNRCIYIELVIFINNYQELINVGYDNNDHITKSITFIMNFFFACIMLAVLCSLQNLISFNFLQKKKRKLSFNIYIRWKNKWYRKIHFLGNIMRA